MGTRVRVDGRCPASRRRRGRQAAGRTQAPARDARPHRHPRAGPLRRSLLLPRQAPRAGRCRPRRVASRVRGTSRGNSPGGQQVTAWRDRQQVPAAYLNPALVATVLAAASDGYRTERRRTMSWPLAFLVAPLVLHRTTRQALPRTTATHLTAWVSRNAALHAGFPARARSL